MDKDTALAVLGTVQTLASVWLLLLRRDKMIHYLTITEAAERIGIDKNHCRRLYERNLVPTLAMLGRQRCIREEDLAGLKAAAKKAGYMPG